MGCYFTCNTKKGFSEEIVRTEYKREQLCENPEDHSTKRKNVLRGNKLGIFKNLKEVYCGWGMLEKRRRGIVYVFVISDLWLYYTSMI